MYALSIVVRIAHLFWPFFIWHLTEAFVAQYSKCDNEKVCGIHTSSAKVPSETFANSQANSNCTVREAN